LGREGLGIEGFGEKPFFSGVEGFEEAFLGKPIGGVFG
jgi:hypothetical protein